MFSSTSLRLVDVILIFLSPKLSFMRLSHYLLNLFNALAVVGLSLSSSLFAYIRFSAQALAALVLSLVSAVSLASAYEDELSFQGFTGLFHTPSATTLSHGMSAYQYSDQLFLDGQNRHANSTTAYYGLLPGFEISGRIAWVKTHNNLFLPENPGPRDLSANFKWRLPFIPKEWFSLAVGIEDVGGQASFFHSEYAVVSRDFGFFRLHAGVASAKKRANTGDKRLDGGFGGLEIKLFDKLTILAEHNSDYANAGIKLNLPLNRLSAGASLQVSALLYSTEPDVDGNSVDGTFGGLALRIPIGGSIGRTSTQQSRTVSAVSLETEQHVRDEDKNQQAPGIASTGIHQPKVTPVIDTPENSTASLDAKITPMLAQRLVAKLERVGFSDVSVGHTQANELWVKFENKVFNRNVVDAIGFVAGVACENLAANQSVVLVLTQQKVAVQELLFSPRACAYLTDPAAAQFLPAVSSVKDSRFKTITVLAEGKKTVRFKPRLSFSPSLSNGVATEYGVLDYSAGLYTNLAINLGQGLMLSASHIDVLDESEDFQRGGAFYNARLLSGSNEWSIQQTFPFGRRVWNTFQYGRFGKLYRGVFDHINFLSDNGKHRFTYRYGDFVHEQNIADERQVRIASYRHYVQRYDFSVEYFYGQFFNGDKGSRVDTTFWFGDMAVGLYYRNTDAEFIGIRWTLPLDVRKSNNNLPVLISGRDTWNYQLQTRINEDSNVISFGGAAIPKWNWEPERLYFNNDRIGAAYMHRQAHRMQEAYQSYKHLDAQ